jgi:hypothetical protein
MYIIVNMFIIEISILQICKITQYATHLTQNPITGYDTDSLMSIYHFHNTFP